MLTSPSTEEVCLCVVSVGLISTCKPAIKRRAVYMYIFTPSEYKLGLENCLTTMIVKNYSPDRYIFIFSHLYAQNHIFITTILDIGIHLMFVYLHIKQLIAHFPHL